MKKIIFILSFFLFLDAAESTAQGLQPGECAIMFTYDAAGNMTLREFYCNNTGGVVYRTANDEKAKNDSAKKLNGNKIPANDIINNPDEIIKVNALMPNPTTGKFMIRLGEKLTNEEVLLSDANGKFLERRIQSGNILNFDISSLPSGVYFIRINSQSKVFTFKVIKQ